ncbi:MAG: hypothetical protein EPN97_04950 [Alphaproteobacteria bacterium]|nr:MAG: hypothetical protein EPN97_04950 [Alphaproteobacteria bacterium]
MEGLFPSEADFARAQAECSVRALYRTAGLALPKKIVWRPSPRALVSEPPPGGPDAGKGVKYLLHPDWAHRWETMTQGPLNVLWRLLGQSAAMPIRRSLRRLEAPNNQWVPERLANLCAYKYEMQLMDLYRLYLDEILNPHDRESLHQDITAAESVEFMLPYEHVCLVSEPPVSIRFDSRGLLHCTDGPAITYRDGWKVYAVEGAWTPEYVIEKPELITPESIDKEPNVALRRVMTRYYKGDYYSDCCAELQKQDRLGKLYRKERRHDSDFVFVRVINSTREPDGSFREYTLRVPPTVKTPTEGIAWSFGMTPDEYLKTQKMT